MAAWHPFRVPATRLVAVAAGIDVCTTTIANGRKERERSAGKEKEEV